MGGIAKAKCVEEIHQRGVKGCKWARFEVQVYLKSQLTHHQNNTTHKKSYEIFFAVPPLLKHAVALDCVGTCFGPGVPTPAQYMKALAGISKSVSFIAFAALDATDHADGKSAFHAGSYKKSVVLVAHFEAAITGAVSTGEGLEYSR